MFLDLYNNTLNFCYLLYNTTLVYYNTSYIEEYYYSISLVNNSDDKMVSYYKVDYFKDNHYYNFLKIYLVFVYLFLVLLLFISIIFIFYMYNKMKKHEEIYKNILYEHTILKNKYIKLRRRKRYLK